MGTIFLATTHTAKSKTQSGIQTVVCGLIAGLATRAVDFRPVRWVPWRKVLSPLRPRESDRLSVAHLIERIVPAQLKGLWLLLPEVIYRVKQQRVIRYARKQKMRVAAIIHDAIPVSHPKLVRRQAAKYHAEYMTALCDVDLVFATSESVAEEFRLFANENRLSVPPIRVCSLPAESIGQPRAPARLVDSDPVNILCVSTLEPRKNHKTLLEAFDLACANSPRKLRLHLAGDRHKDAAFVVEIVKAAIARNPNVTWHGKIDNAQIADLYRQCDFTVYPSFLEGFGLPIGESLWHRRPCICANFGAMAETAAGGGCITVDVRDPEKLRDAIVALATDVDLRQELGAQIEQRRLRTWSDYAGEICEALAIR